MADLVHPIPKQVPKPKVAGKPKKPKRSNAAKKAAYDQARLLVEARSRGRCEATLIGCDVRGNQAHHMLRRSQGGPDTPENLLWVCTPCHDRIHRHPERSYARGHLRRRSA